MLRIHGEHHDVGGQIPDDESEFCDGSCGGFDLGEVSGEVIDEAFRGLGIEVECDGTCPHETEIVVEPVSVSIRFSGAEMNEEVQDHGDVPGHKQEIVHGVRVEVLGHGRQNEVDVYQEVTLLLVEYHHGRFERLVCDWRFA